ncbi:hypothetical protein NMSP_0714 [Candidatus Nitrosomarinus catalina]|jgi:hypothetical protein|uniref:Uncharacterized protein n=1 Tax=Candidatus Nitrosomarinus catalinensis TaxID=1898749 RepID=A0A2Z2HKQ7_9ARCH|nr:hypothetical protein [Candidatus Nitrosomarinus catalina]ARS64335.1 hypothetical protein NMSP_0714 [Candidatus Nitrosomarinus catalina]
MVISSAQEYVEFFINLNMGNEVSLLRFINNEKMTLKQKLKNKINEKEPIEQGINILESIIKEISENGEPKVLSKYQTSDERNHG